MLTLIEADGRAVVIGNVAVFAPAGTVTFAGTVTTEARLLARVITAPPAGAGLCRMTVPTDGRPPTTRAGWTIWALIPAGFRAAGVPGVTWSEVVARPPPEAAVIRTETVARTGVVATSKRPVVWPAGTRTLSGTRATVGLALARAMTASPAGADPDSVTVPVAAAPPATLVGCRARETTAGGRIARVARRVSPGRRPRPGPAPSRSRTPPWWLQRERERSRARGRVRAIRSSGESPSRPEALGY
jgi:hypothetical protein